MKSIEYICSIIVDFRLMENQTRYINCFIMTIFLFSNLLTGQNIPIDIKHPVNDLIFRYHTRGIVKTIHPGLRPYSITEVISALDEISMAELSQKERKLLYYFKKEFELKNLNEGLQGPWQQVQLKNAIKGSFSVYNPSKKEIRFLSFKDEELTVWSDWEELVSIDVIDNIQRLFYNDRVTISGQFKNKLSFFSRYSLYRVEHKDSYPMPKEFKQGSILLEENTDWLVWDISEASLSLNNPILNIEISKIPIYWGFSKQHSPILSANVQPFSFIRVSKQYKRLRAQSIIGSLIPFGDLSEGSIDEKHIAAHRFEFDLTQRLTVSFSEMVIYARRNIELGYLLPVNLFWSEEHGLGDRDNVLMSFDLLWNTKPGLSLYSTFFWDELSWFNLSSPWWGNKFIFQSGLHWVPFANPQLPDVRVEWSASRPWVYTHKDSLLTYTSSEIGLGFPLGPNSQLLFIEMNMWPTYNTNLSFNFSYLVKGSGIGSDPNDNYNLRNKSLDYKTSMLMGDTNGSLIIGTELHYRITELLNITGNFSYNNDEEIFEGRIGLLMNY